MGWCLALLGAKVTDLSGVAKKKEKRYYVPKFALFLCAVLNL